MLMMMSSIAALKTSAMIMMLKTGLATIAMPKLIATKAVATIIMIVIQMVPFIMRFVVMLLVMFCGCLRP